MNEKELEILISNLTEDEAYQVKVILNSSEIPFVISGHYVKSRYLRLSYQIRVERENLSIAKRIIVEYLGQVFINR